MAVAGHTAKSKRKNLCYQWSWPKGKVQICWLSTTWL